LITNLITTTQQGLPQGFILACFVFTHVPGWVFGFSVRRLPKRAPRWEQRKETSRCYIAGLKGVLLSTLFATWGLDRLSP